MYLCYDTNLFVNWISNCWRSCMSQAKWQYFLKLTSAHHVITRTYPIFIIVSHAHLKMKTWNLRRIRKFASVHSQHRASSIWSAYLSSTLSLLHRSSPFTCLPVLKTVTSQRTGVRGSPLHITGRCCRWLVGSPWGLDGETNGLPDYGCHVLSSECLQFTLSEPR